MVGAAYIYTGTPYSPEFIVWFVIVPDFYFRCTGYPMGFFWNKVLDFTSLDWLMGAKQYARAPYY